MSVENLPKIRPPAPSGAGVPPGVGPESRARTVAPPGAAARSVWRQSPLFWRDSGRGDHPLDYMCYSERLVYLFRT